MDEVFRRILSNITLDWVGFLAFFGLAVFRWRVLLPLVPMLVLGLLSFQSSNRFIMYLAPFIGIGLGWLLHLVVEGAFYVFTQRRKVAKKTLSAAEKTNHSDAKVVTQKRKEAKELKRQLPETEFGDIVLTKVDWWNWFRQGVLYLGMAVFFWLISGQTAISFVPGPSIHTGLYATFFEVKKRVPEDAALLTWWDYGYAITDATGLATFHDGSAQFSPKTYFIARGLISADPEELYDITQYLATEGSRGISKNNTSHEALLEAVRNPKLKPWDPIYLFFTSDMTGKYGAISKLGSWDIVKGGSKPRGYQNLACNKITNEEMNCRGAKIDLKAGKINNQVAIKRMLFIRDGKVLREQEFGHAQGYNLQLLVAGNQIVEVQLIDEVVFKSNYNQMFLLGRYREDLYEETYNAFPFSRLFRVKF
jgi:dolichyl-diphosphooligosaccharide--protein glycosyltransferase